MTVEIEKIKITSIKADAIVNSANKKLKVSNGLCGGIFKAAGRQKLEAVCNSIGHCNTGKAILTPAFDLAAKYIIHTVGPVWHGGNSNEDHLLYSAYIESLRLAYNTECHSIVFPLISTGLHNYPIDKAWYVALRACRDFLQYEGELKIIFSIIDDKIFTIGTKVLGEIISCQEKVATKDDWKIQDMPSKNETFLLEREFTPEEMNSLRKGNIPKAMEDKWFWYMEDNTLYAYRSWTGYCIYKIAFSSGNSHHVTVNRNPEQYTCTDIEKDISNLNNLLNWWCQPNYDHYGEWLSETYSNIKKAGLVEEE